MVRHDASSSRDGYEIGQRVLRAWLPIEHPGPSGNMTMSPRRKVLSARSSGTGFVTSPGAFGMIGILGGSARTTFGRRRIVRR